MIENKRRFKPSDYLYGAKSFVNPRKCLSLFNHYCYIPYENNDDILDVSTSSALSFHFKQTNDKNECKNEISDSSLAEKLEIFKSTIFTLLNITNTTI